VDKAKIETSHGREAAGRAVRPEDRKELIRGLQPNRRVEVEVKERGRK